MVRAPCAADLSMCLTVSGCSAFRSLSAGSPCCTRPTKATCESLRGVGEQLPICRVPPAAGLMVCPEERGHVRVASGAQVVLRKLPDEPC